MRNGDTASINSLPTAKPKNRWRRAWRALRELLDDPSDTAKAQDVFMAIGATDFERNYQRFLLSRSGQPMSQCTSLVESLSDRQSLELLPEGSLGRCYLDYLDANGFEPLSLIELSRGTQDRWEREEGIAPRDSQHIWFSDRMALCHDLFHVVSGYGTDNVNEAALLVFSQPQLQGKANALLTFGATLKLYREHGFVWLRYAYQAWCRGRRARWLPAFPWEETLSLPLATVRFLADIEPLTPNQGFAATHNRPPP
ncbi:MAG: Coq4 family protein [Pseudomonadales bacterium]